MPPTGDIEFRVDDAIATLTLNRAAKRNALTLDMLDQIDAALACVERDPRIGVLLVESASEQCFCSGADIKEWGDLDPQRMGSRWIRSGNRVFRRLAELDIPSIAVLAGDALGGGLELALACDLRYASRDARLGFPEAAVGAIPGWLGCRRLAGLVGPARSRQLVLTGEAISAERAESWGILNEVLPAGQLSSRVSEVCSVLLSRSSTSLSVGKRLLRARRIGRRRHRPRIRRLGLQGIAGRGRGRAGVPRETPGAIRAPGLKDLASGRPCRAREPAGNRSPPTREPYGSRGVAATAKCGATPATCQSRVDARLGD